MSAAHGNPSAFSSITNYHAAVCLASGASEILCTWQSSARVSFTIKHEFRLAYLTPSSFDQASLTILDRISQLEQKIDDGFTKLQRQTALNSSSQEDHGNRLSPRGDASFSPLRDAPHGGDVLTHSMLENGAQSRHESAPKTMDGPPSSDVILMASHFTVESVLRWPIFTQIFPELEGLIAASPTELIGNSKHVNPRIGDVTKSVQASLLGCEPKSLEGLVQNFIKSNYGKNPIFDIDALCLEARRVEEHGISWDAGSCLIVSIFQFNASCFTQFLLSNIPIRNSF